MKVILNKDLAPLGEEGDVKDVARGYARNYLFPREIALPYTPRIVKIFEARRAEIEARKEQKRKDAMGLKEKLEALEISIAMPAGANGRLYGALTNQTVADELAKNGFQIERKRIELLGSGFKVVGKYRAAVKLYESQSAEIGINITAQEIKTESPAKPARRGGRREEQQKDAKGHASEAASAEAAAQAGAEASAAENTASGGVPGSAVQENSAALET